MSIAKRQRSISILGKTYLTGCTPRALWQRFCLWRAYRRPVTYNDLRRIAHDVCYRHGDPHKTCPVGASLFDSIVHEAEAPVFRDSE